MGKPYFQFKQFTVFHDRCAMKVGTDGVLLGAWTPLSGQEKQILDIGTGSGLIALMLAQRCPLAQIEGIDVEENAVEQARINFDASPWKNRLVATHIALQEFTQSCCKKFDLIVSNPPYFINSLKNPVENRAMARHTDTLSHSDLLQAVNVLLANDGYFCVIMPIEEGDAFIQSALEFGFFLKQKTRVYSRQGMIPKRYLLSFSQQQIWCTETALTIETAGRHIYSDEYKKLTADFYL